MVTEGHMVTSHLKLTALLIKERLFFDRFITTLTCHVVVVVVRLDGRGCDFIAQGERVPARRRRTATGNTMAEDDSKRKPLRIDATLSFTPDVWLRINSGQLRSTPVNSVLVVLEQSCDIDTCCITRSQA